MLDKVISDGFKMFLELIKICRMYWMLMHVCVSVYALSSASLCVHGCACVSEHVCVHGCTCVHARVCARLCVCVSTHMCVHVCVCVYMSVCVCARACAHGLSEYRECPVILYGLVTLCIHVLLYCFLSSEAVIFILSANYVHIPACICTTYLYFCFVPFNL